MSEQIEQLRLIGTLEAQHEQATAEARERAVDLVNLVKTVGAKRFTAETVSLHLPSLDEVSYVEVAEEITTLEDSIPGVVETAIEAATEVLRQQLAVEQARQHVVDPLVNDPPPSL